MQAMRLILLTAVLVPMSIAAETGDDRYIETIVVRGDREDVNVLDRSMTVTGLNEALIEQLGVTSNNDLEALVPGLQMGFRGSRGEHGNLDDHIYIRGVGSQPSFGIGFSDTAVATYVDGVYTDSQYALEPGNLFDVERVEVARGPQGATGGKPGIAGSISYYTRRPTDTFDLKFLGEYTDQFTQRYALAFGGPIGGSNLAYRINASYWDGEGAQKNVGPGGDYAKPDQIVLAPQLRYSNDRWDINLRLSHTRDEGVRRTTVELAGRNIVDACFVEGTDAQGNDVCIVSNPFFGASQAPSIRDCDNVNDDGTLDPDQVICDTDDLRNVLDYNTTGIDDSSLSRAMLEIKLQLTDGLRLEYKLGYNESEETTVADTDRNSRTGGGTCPGEPEPSPFCALDGLANGTFVDRSSRWLYSSRQRSHELTLVSDLDGPLNFLVGAFYSERDDPATSDVLWHEDELLHTDNTEICEFWLSTAPPLSGDGTPLLVRDLGPYSGEWTVYGCPGDFPNWRGSGTSTGNREGKRFETWRALRSDSLAAYANVEYQLNDRWSVFGGVRHDEDHKSVAQNEIRTAIPFLGTVFDWWLFVNADVPGLELYDDAEWNDLTWSVGVEYRPQQDLMAYGRVSTGYRAGGFGWWAFGTPEDLLYPAEEVTNYEIGVKGLYFDNVLQLSTSVFYEDFGAYWAYTSRVIPIEERTPDRFGWVEVYWGHLTTIDDTWIAGLEIEGAWRISDRLTLRGFYNYLDSAIGDLPTTYCCDPDQENEEIEVEDAFGNRFLQSIPPLTNFGGNQLPNQPTHKFSTTLSYDAPLARTLGHLTLLTTLTYTDEKFADQANLPKFVVPEYTRWDARATWASPSNLLDVTLFVTNLLDQIAVQQWSPGAASRIRSAPMGTLTDGRRVGLQFNYQLGPR